jgi:hypothetical protein
MQPLSLIEQLALLTPYYAKTTIKRILPVKVKQSSVYR